VLTAAQSILYNPMYGEEMKTRNDIFDILIISKNTTILVIFAIICVAVILFVASLPHILESPSNDWNKLSATSTYVYMLITFFTFVVIVITAFLTLRQLSEIRKSRQLDIIFEISKIYSTQEMYHALRTVFDDPAPPEKFIKNRQKDFQRRLVVNFWETVAWAALEDPTVSKLIHSRFEQAIKEAWVKLRPLEIAKRLEITEREHKEWRDEKKYALAEHHVNCVLPFERCFASWAALQKQEADSSPSDL
jgi:hypothetical protein